MVPDTIIQNLDISGEGNIVVGKGDVIINPLPPAETRLRHDLGILLKNVENTWIKGVLEKSVHEAALLELGMELREEAVDNPWHMVLEGSDQSRETLPRERKIKDIFDEANRLLLILGEPGSGKTTTLLQLARDLIADVDQAFTQPVPVILNLSTWTNKQQPLDEWLVSEMNSKYRLPKRDGQSWLRERRILPLLDGLDEVKPENRMACVEKINQLVSDYGLQGLVVCSRIKDYTALNVRLAFYRAIYIQPLTPEQIDEYLDRVGDKLASLRATLQADRALQDLARSPLILNIMSLAYQNTSADALSKPSFTTDKARRQHLFDTYITRMLSRKAGKRLYDDEQIKRRLSWLAQNMQQHNQEVFLIEGLQPNWLKTRSWQWGYILVCRLIGGLIVGLCVGLISSLFFGLTDGISAGLRVGLPLGLVDLLRFELLRKQNVLEIAATIEGSVATVLITSLTVGLIVGLIVGFGSGGTVPLITGWIVGSIVGLFFGLRGSRQNLVNDIQTVEALRWSSRKAVKGGLIGGLIAGLLGLIVKFGNVFGGSFLFGSPFLCLRVASHDACLRSGFADSLIPMLIIGGLVGVIFGGLSHEIVETKSIPNQGIQLSIINAIFGGLIIGVSAGLVSFLFFGVQDGLIVGVILAPVFGLIGVLWYGGLDVIQHYILRLILFIQDYTPRNYARFLDYSADRIFLQKVGGGYRFIHRLLLEHFADMTKVGEGVSSQGSN